MEDIGAADSLSIPLKFPFKHTEQELYFCHQMLETTSIVAASDDI